ncbi:hypothetical protein KDU71_07420 [Carboxylicivirga sediminis]|uniref:Uncharacterized protein n=1 Tax=Carboxylicivirga sediminis TaxID=2006564 RepID=A0A941F537_9BACT|nr:hypothetical protein [Carboxylicivirga sediminis]MBR8535385.1 hypothetical protein [Carboxylicivirga sediminis]
MKEKELDKLINPEFIAKLIAEQTDAVTEKPLIFKAGDVNGFVIDDDSMIPEGKAVNEIAIRPLKVITVMHLTPLCLSIPKSDLDKIIANKKFNLNTKTIELLHKHADTLLEVICIGLHNRKDDYPAWFKDFLKANFTWEDLHVFLNAILFRMNHKSFLNSIILTKKMSPMDDKGIIACRKNLQSHLISTKSSSMPSKPSQA